MGTSTVTTLRPAVTGADLAAALFYAHPEATAATLLHVLTSQPVPNTVVVAALAALRGYRVQDKERVTLIANALRDVLEIRKDFWADTADVHAVTCGRN